MNETEYSPFTQSMDVCFFLLPWQLHIPVLLCLLPAWLIMVLPSVLEPGTLISSSKVQHCMRVCLQVAASDKLRIVGINKADKLLSVGAILVVIQTVRCAKQTHSRHVAVAS